MKMILISDFHLSLDKPIARTDKDFVKTQFDKLKSVLDFADNTGAIILQAGDFFHTPRSWGLLPMVWDLLKQFKTRIHVVFGQHDRYMYSQNTESTNLGILIKGGLVKELTYEGIVYGDYKIYGCGYGDWLTKGLPSPDGNINVLVIHREITDQRISKFQENWIKANEWVENTKFNITLCGDIHRQFWVNSKSNTKHLFNSGPLIRRECSEDMLNHKPGFFFWNTETRGEEIELIELHHLPANEVFSEYHIESIKAKEEKKDLFESFIQAMGDSSLVKGVKFDENLNLLMEKTNPNKNVRGIISKTMEEASND